MKDRFDYFCDGSPRKIFSTLSLLLCFLAAIVTAPIFAQAQLEETGIIPTDPGMNRINWAKSSYGSTISGGTTSGGGFPLSALIDGLGSSFSAGFSTLNIPSGESHIINLGQPREIHRVQIHLYDGDNRFFRYFIEASLDGENYETIIDKTTGEHRGIQRSNIEPITAQYFKITGTHSSLNNSFHLIDEIFLIGDELTTPHETELITIDAKDDGGNGVTDGVMRELNAGVYLVEFVSGASSLWSDDSANGGKSWDSRLRIRVPQNFKIYNSGFVHNKLDRFATPEEAEAARLGHSFFIYLPVEAPVYFQYPDSNPSDNRGAQTYRLSQVSGPNDALIVQVRDAILRSLAWQENTVANWENWMTTSNRNCFGCHIQTQSSVGFNDIKATVAGIPVSESLELEFVDAYKTWQNSAGWVSPFHGSSYRRTQTSLWAWAVSTFREQSFQELLPNLINASQWLRSQQAGNGGWNSDHNSAPLYTDGTPSAAHTTGNIQAFMRLVMELSDSDPNDYADDTTVGQLRNSVRAATNLYSNDSWNYGRNVRTTAQTVVGLNSALPIITPENLPAAINRIAQASQLLRNAQRPDGGWSDLTAGGGASTPMQSAQALYALLQVVDQNLDDKIFSAIEYLLTTQREDGSWNAPPGLTQRLVSTTWVEIALPLIFQQLTNEFARDTINDLTAIGLVNSVELRWSPMQGATGYNVYRRSLDGAFQKIATNHQGNTVLYFDHDVQVEATYLYMVRWLNSAGTESADSNEASGTPSGLVCGGDSPPVILSAPITEGLENVLYQYQVDAYDPDEGDVLTFSLKAAPEGMSIDPDTGLVQWLPTSAQLGGHFVRVWVEDQIGRFATQAFILNIAKIFFNEPPVFVSEPITEAVAGYEYLYFALAEDPNIGDILTYSLVEFPEGMTINHTTGLIRWTPALDLEGSFPVTVQVVDAGGLSDQQSFSIQIQQNQPPVITSLPPLTALRGQAYIYQVEASDPEGAQLTYHLTQNPSGMTIQKFTGLLLWTPAMDLDGTFPVTIEVKDPAGLTAIQSYLLEVPENTPPQFQSSPLTVAEVNQTYQFQATAIDYESDNLLYSVDSGPSGFSINATTGLVTWTPGVEGDFNVQLRVSDPEGLFDTLPYTITVYPEGTGVHGGGPGDGNAPGVPIAIINNPLPGSTISDLTDLHVTIIDPNPDDEFEVSWVIELRREGQSSGDELQSGTGPINDQFITTIDPGVMANDSYRIWVHMDYGTQVYSSWFPYEIFSQLKLGAYRAIVQDLVLPLNGVSIEISREYRSYDLGKYQFGNGWRLRYPGSVVDSASENPFHPFTANERVFVTLPSGERVGFTFQPFATSPFFPWLQVPYFLPDPGVNAILEVDATSVTPSGGLYYEFLGGPFNPSVYYLTTQENIRYTVVEGVGITKIQDANLNTLTFTDNSIHHSSGESVQIERDGAGRITRIVPPGGGAIDYTYNGAGNLTSVQMPDGDTWDYTYDAGNRLLTVEDPDGIVQIQNFYDATGRLFKQLDANGNEIEITVDLDENLESVTDKLGNTTHQRFDDAGNLIELINPLGEITHYTYDSKFNMTSMTDPAGNVTEWEYNQKGLITREVDPLGRETVVSYNNLSLPTSITYPDGSVYLRSYDSKGNLLSATDPMGRTMQVSYDSTGNILAMSDPLGSQWNLQYNSVGRIVSTTDPNGNEQQITYDSSGNILSITVNRTDNGGNLHPVVTSFTYDEQNRPLSVTDPEGYTAYTEWTSLNKPKRFTDKRGFVFDFEYDHVGNLTSIIYPDLTNEEYEYDAEFNRISFTDRNGNKTQYVYDELSRKVQTVHPDGSIEHVEYDEVGNTSKSIDPLGAVTEYLYDEVGRRIETINQLGGVHRTLFDEFDNLVEATDPLGRITLYTYETGGRVLQEILPDGSITSHAYDVAGQKISTTDPAGFVMQFEYDHLGRQAKTIDQLGAETELVYDELGNILKIIDPLGNVTLYSYDNLGRMIEQIEPTGEVLSWSYDPHGNLLSHTDAAGNTTTHEYDFNNRLTETTDPSGAITQFTYDAVGNRTSLHDAAGNTTLFSYDNRNRVISQQDPIGGIITTEYDAAGNIVRRTDRNGRIKEFEYDELRRKTVERWIEGDSVVREKTFSYDLTNNVLQASDAYTTYSYTYDSNDSLLTIDTTGSTVIPEIEITKGYDPRGYPVLIEDDRGTEVQSVYNARGELIARTHLDGTFANAHFEFTHDDARRETEMHGYLSSDDSTPWLSQHRTLDPSGRVTAYLYQDPIDQLLLEQNVQYDAAGRVELITEDGEQTTFGYDNRGQVTSAEYSAHPNESFSYDATGNRIGAEIVIGAGNRLLEDADYTYSYDLEGNLVRRTTKATDDYEDFFYNHDNQLERVEFKDSADQLQSVLEYRYDLYGRRISRSVNGTTELYLYDGASIWSDLNPEGEKVRQYLHRDGIDQPLAALSETESEAFLTGHLGTVMGLANSSSGLSARTGYSAFGTKLTESGMPSRYTFTAREYEPELNLYFYRARMYDPTTGRFLSQDPLGFDAGDVNLYRYAFNAPTHFRDPSGMLVEKSFTYHSAAMLAAAARSTAPFQAQIAMGLRGVASSPASIAAAKELATAQAFFRASATFTGPGLGLTKALATRGLGLAAITLALHSDQAVVEIQPDGTVQKKVEVALSPSADSSLKLEAEEVRRRGKRCDPKNPRPLYPDRPRFRPHTPPACWDWEGKSCFRSLGEGIGLSLAAWSKPDRRVPGGSGRRRQRCFDRPVGIGSNGEPRYCVTIEVKQNCYFHGWPSRERRKGRFGVE